MKKNVESGSGVGPSQAAQPAIADVAPARSLQPVAPEIPTVSEELYTRTREALAREGFSVVIPIKPLSIGQLGIDVATRGRFDYISSSEEIRAIVPSEMEVAINPKHLRVKGSNCQSTDTQIRMIREEEEALKGRLPQDVRDIISMSMPSASVLAQLDIEYRDRTGEPFFTGWFGRTSDQTDRGYVANVGRYNPFHRLLDVCDWDRGRLIDVVFAVPVVVLPRKLAVEERAKNGTPEIFSSPTTEVVFTPSVQVEVLRGEALQAELEAQAKRYTGFGFPKRLGVSSGRFKDSIMGLAVPQPEIYRGRFDIPAIIIGTQIPVAEQYRMVGVEYYLENLKLQDVDPRGYRTPDIPNVVWMQDGGKYRNASVNDARSSFGRDERGATIYDGVGLYVARPQALKDHSVDLPGTQTMSERVPYLSFWGGRQKVFSHFTDNDDPGSYSVSCGR